MKLLQAITFFVVTVAFGFMFLPVSNPCHREMEIFTRFERITATVERSSNSFSCSVAIGYNTNLDLIVPFDQFFAQFMALTQLDFSGEGQDQFSITSAQDFISAFSYYLPKGSAAERSVTNATLWREVILKATEGVRDSELFLGGNAFLMARKFAENGCSVLLGGAVGDKLKKIAEPWSEKVQYIPMGADMNEEVHLIIEYPTNANIGFSHVPAPRANRFIISRDLTNAEIRAAETFHKALHELTVHQHKKLE